MKRFLLAIFLIPFFLGGCGSNEPTPEEEHYINVLVNDVSLTEGDSYEIPVEVLNPTIVTYRSNNEEIATVNRNGVITAVKEGETSISISGGGDRFILFVTVYPETSKNSLQIIMVKDKFTIALNDTYLLPLTVKYGNEVIKSPTLTYEYENNEIVSINALNVTTKGVGTTKCLVTASYNELEVSDIFTITVYQ